MRSVLFVCLGNICRSPLAEAILRRQAAEAGIDIEIDSAGTGDWHVGDGPDHRAVQIGLEHACEMNLTARQVRSRDFEDFDLIVAMDRSNLADLRRWPGCNPAMLRLASSFDPMSPSEDVPDPYYGDLQGFRQVAEMLERICEGIVKAELDARHDPKN